jgi:hypothetical protein
MNLGQKHLCPVCDQKEEDAVNTAGNAASAPEADYVSQVIGFMENHPEDWDDEFNAFFCGLAGKPDFDECFEACTQVGELLRTGMPDSGRVSGSVTRQVKNKLKSIFPELTNDAAFSLSLDMLKKRTEPGTGAKRTPGEEGEGVDVVVPGRNRLDSYRKLKSRLRKSDVRDDFLKVMRIMKSLLKDYPDYFELDFRNFYYEICLGEVYYEYEKDGGAVQLFSEGTNDIVCPLSLFSALLLPRWNGFVQREMEVIKHLEREAPYSRGGALFLEPDYNLSCFYFEPESSSEPCKFYINGKEKRAFLQKHIQVELDKNDEHRGRWQKLVPEGTNVLILYCGENIDLCHGSGQCAESITPGTVLNGLQYRCRCSSHKYAQAEFAYMVSPE